MDSKLRRGYEVWYFKLNSDDACYSFWGRLTLLKTQSGHAVFEKWAILTEKLNGTVQHWTAKQTLPIQEFQNHSQQIGNSTGFLGLSNTAAHVLPNAITVNTFTTSQQQVPISWDFNFTSTQECFDPVPGIFKKLHLSKSLVLTPHTDSIWNGKVTIPGREIVFTNAKGSQGHIWGSQQAHNWVWAHANHGKTQNGKNYAFEILSAQIRIGPSLFSPPMTAVYLKWDDKILIWNTACNLFKNKAKHSLEQSRFQTEKKDGQHLDITFTTPLHHFAGVTYSDTDGTFLYCHNSKMSELKIDILNNNTICDTILTNAAAFELVCREPDPRVVFTI